MTDFGEFFKLKVNDNKAVPTIGQEYSGIVLEDKFINNNIFKHAVAACVMFLILTFGGGAYAYYKLVSTMDIYFIP